MKRADMTTQEQSNMNASSIKTRTIGLMIGFVGSLGVALSAQAGDTSRFAPTKHESVVVRYDDLNLDAAAGVKALYARIANAADRACGGTPYANELRRKNEYRACYDRAMSKAVQKVGNQYLQAMHQRRAGGSSVG
jgi:UrcA family protein